MNERDAHTHLVLDGERYRVHRNWGHGADSLGLVSQLAVAPDGALVVAQRTGAPVLVIAPDGRHRAALGEGEVHDPHGVFVDRLGRIFLVDRDAHQILIFSLEGEILGRLGERHRPRFAEPFNHPTGVAVADDGEIFVCDGYANTRVHRFSASGEHRTSWGRPGAGDGEFSTPHAIALLADGRVAVADRENDRIQLFSRDGAYLASWGNLYHPMDLFQDRHGRVLVSDQRPSVTMFSPSGELLGRCRPAWNVPHGIAGEPSGGFYVAEMQPSSVLHVEWLGRA